MLFKVEYCSVLRTPGNLLRTLKTMERYGLVRLHKGERDKMPPKRYGSVRLHKVLSTASASGVGFARTAND